MYFLNSNFSIRKPIGTLTKSRVNSLKEFFSKIFPEVIQPSDEILIFKKGVTAFVISPDQITYTAQAEADEIDLNEINEYLLKANEILELSEEGFALLRLEAIISVSENPLDKSKSHFMEVAENLDARGIGFRFIINNSSFHGDIHIEPYLKDIQKLFLKVILDTEENINLENFSEVINEMYLFGTQKAEFAAGKLFSI